MVGLSEEDKAVLSANCIAHGTGLSKHEIAERYNEWAVQESNSYDEVSNNNNNDNNNDNNNKIFIKSLTQYG